MTLISLFPFQEIEMTISLQHYIFCTLSRANVTMPLRYDLRYIYIYIFSTLFRCWSLFTLRHKYFFFFGFREKDKSEVNVRSHLTFSVWYENKNSTQCTGYVRTDKCSRLFYLSETRDILRT